MKTKNSIKDMTDLDLYVRFNMSPAEIDGEVNHEIDLEEAWLDVESYDIMEDVVTYAHILGIKNIYDSTYLDAYRQAVEKAHRVFGGGPVPFEFVLGDIVLNLPFGYTAED